MDYAALIAAIAGIIGGLVAAGKEGEAQKLREKMAAQYGPEILPDLEKAVAETAGDSKFADLAPDHQAQATQDEVSSQLADIYDTGGQTLQDQAAYDVARRGVAQRAASNAGNVAIESARRGGGNGGANAALASQAGQDELEALAGLNAQIATSGRDRALQALTARGGLATSQRGQSWTEASGKASAMDLMNRFNASQEQAAGMYNAGLGQQNFNNILRLNQARDGATAGVVGGLEKQGDDARQTAAGIGNSSLSYGQAWDWSQDPENPKNKGK